VVLTHLQLPAPHKRVASANHGDLRREVPLSIQIVNRALPLAASDVAVINSKARGERRAFGIGYETVVGSRPSLLSHVKPSVDGQAQVIKPARTYVEVCDRSWTERVRKADGDALAFCILFAAVLAEARSERILRQAGQLPE